MENSHIHTHNTAAFNLRQLAGKNDHFNTCWAHLIPLLVLVELYANSPGVDSLDRITPRVKNSFKEKNKIKRKTHDYTFSLFLAPVSVFLFLQIFALSHSRSPSHHPV